MAGAAGSISPAEVTVGPNMSHTVPVKIIANTAPAAIPTFPMSVEVMVVNNQINCWWILSFLQPSDIAKDAYESEEIMKETKDSVPETKHREKEKGIDVFKSELDREHARKSKEDHENDNASEKMVKKIPKKKNQSWKILEREKMVKTEVPHAELSDVEDEKLNLRKT
ncbi:hypothetical protein AgCh_014795 [Apium graveolens]